ncbi:MAG: hypothetical protein U0X20_23395 [Caldilineaceae bacterium]
MLIVSSDITDRKRTEDALAGERNLLKTLMDNLPDYIFIKDTASRYITANTALCAIARRDNNRRTDRQDRF